jgi:gluconate 2-dehydrogenase gamma chain
MKDMQDKPQTELLECETDKKAKGVSRRDFLKGSAAATVLVAAVATGCTKVGPTVTQTVTATPAQTATPTASPTPAPAKLQEVYAFFNQNEAVTMKAIAAQIIPGSAQDPGAAEVGAHVYVDHALAGAYSSQQQSYKRGLAAINAYSQSLYKGNFASLTASQQNGILADMQTGKATGFYGPTAAAFFTTLVAHVREGTFSDPLYGGNLNLAGWKMVGFPGAQVAYGDTDMVTTADQSKKSPISLADEESIPMPMPASGF